MHWLDFVALPREEKANMVAFYNLRNGDPKEVKARRNELLRENMRKKARALDARSQR